MKEKYAKPVALADEFSLVEVITTSTESTTDDAPDTDIPVPWS